MVREAQVSKYVVHIDLLLQCMVSIVIEAANRIRKALDAFDTMNVPSIVSNANLITQLSRVR